MFSVFALLVTVACVAASVRRLRMAIAPTAVDPRPLVEALRGDAGRANAPAIREAIEGDPDAEWERELVLALKEEGDLRTARINELLGDLDFSIQSWSAVPRVCARIAAGMGLLLGALALRQGLAVPDDVPVEIRELALHAAVIGAIDAAAIGVCGAVLCIALGHHASKAAKVRLTSTDELVERLEALAK